MARLARGVAPGAAHAIIQRGNRRQQTFFCDDDYECYLDLMAESCEREGVEVWAYCLMPNHVHLVAVPSSEDALRRGIGEAHRRYTRRVNFREGWRGHLWQSDEEAELLRRHERTGRPLGSVSFLDRLERLMDRVLLPRRAGRKRKARQ